jgi:hypothetical protein
MSTVTAQACRASSPTRVARALLAWDPSRPAAIMIDVKAARHGQFTGNLKLILNGLTRRQLPLGWQRR